MSRFAATHKIDLSGVGEDWASAYLLIRVPSWEESNAVASMQSGEPIEVAQNTFNYAIEHVIEGKAPVDGKLVDIKPEEDIQHFPVTAIRKLTEVVVNGRDLVDPKSLLE